ncbi:MAG: DUF1902 domain-containing protein [Leptolyngbyaceae cyanobacterium CRU_2_3]|nr:DUF1902 domain-containing protein [Leptolyngbyaceae cyanobacterium CRU_2_3]
MEAIYQVDAFWDPDSAVWVATSEDVPGLATEADTIEILSQKLRNIIPELLRLNHVIAVDYTGAIVFQLTSHRQASLVTLPTVSFKTSWTAKGILVEFEPIILP